MNINWIKEWITDVARKLAKEMTFDEWISGFEDRYPPNVLDMMRGIWDDFRNN